VPVIAQELELTETTVRTWLSRFNKEWLYGLTDLYRSGRPATYSAEQVAEVIAAALSDLRQLGQRFGCWMLDRLERYLNIKR
jgi:transposase